MQISKLVEADIPELLEIEKQCHATPWSEQSFRNELDHEHGIFLIAREKGKMIGYASLWVIADEAHITNLAVLPTEQGKGFGKQLVLEILHQSVDQGATCATLEVRTSNKPALTVYESFGFKACGVRKRYYPDNNEDAIVMWLYDLTNVLD